MWTVLRPVAGRDPGPDRVVRVHPLAGRGARQQLEEHLEVAERGDQLLDPDDADQRVRQRQAHPPVALGLGDEQPAGLGDREVRAADRDLGLQEQTSEVQARGLGERVGVVGEVLRRVGHVVEEDPADLGPVAVERRHHDVARPVVRQLDDQLREVGLVRGDPGVLERFDEPDLLGRHRLDLDDLVVAGRLDQIGDDRCRLGGVAGPVDVGATRGGIAVRTARGSRSRWCRTSSLIAAPAWRSSCQSGVSATRPARRSLIVAVALRTLRRSCEFSTARLAFSGKFGPARPSSPQMSSPVFTPALPPCWPGSRRGGACARRRGSG